MSIKHKKVSTIPNGSNNNLIQPADWNDLHIMEPAVKGILYDELGDGNITGLHVTGLLQDKDGDGLISGVRVQGLLNDPLGNGNIVGVHVTGVLSDPDGDGNYIGIKVTGLWKDDGAGNITGVIVKGLHYDAAGNNVITGLRVTGILQDKNSDGTITGIRVTGLLNDRLGDGNFSGVQVRGLLNDASGNGNYSGVQYRGLLMDKVGNGNYSGVTVQGVHIDPNGDNNIIGVAATSQGQYLRRKYNTVNADYEFSSFSTVVSIDFQFTITVAGLALTTGSNVITVPKLPNGINASSPSKHYLFISDAVAGNEALLITAVNVGASQFTINCTKAHAIGNWTIQSATAGIQEAIHSASGTGKGLRILIPAGRHVMRERIFVVNVSASPITIIGEGSNCTELTRSTGHIAGAIFRYDSSVVTTKFILSGIRILHGQDENGAYIATNSNVYALNMSGSNAFIFDVEIMNGYAGIALNGINNVVLDNVSFIQEVAYTAIMVGGVGIILGGGSGPVNYNILINNCRVIGGDVTHANYLPAGMDIRFSAGSQIINSYFAAQIGIAMQGLNSLPISNVLINNCTLDKCKLNGFQTNGNNSPNLFMNIKIANCNIVGDGTTNFIHGINIGGDIDYISVIGNTISNFGGMAIFISPAINFEGVAQRSIIIANNMMYGNNLSNNAEGGGIRIFPNATGFVISGNVITNRTVAGLSNYAIVINDISDSYIIGNKFSNNKLSPILLYSTITNCVITNNVGIDNVIPTIAAASAIAIGFSPVILVTGTVQINTITPVWQGRKITIIWGDAAPGGVGWTPTGNIVTAHAGVVNNTLSLVYYSPYWM